MERALIDAAIACIDEYGVGGSPVGRIARRANATGGSVQHHFGTRDGLMLRVVEDFGERFKAVTQGLSPAGASLGQRVEKICDAYWRIVSSSHYLVAMQILFAARDNEALYAQIFSRLKGFERALDDHWVRVFQGSGVDEAQIIAVRHVAIAAMRGFAIRATYRNDSTRWARERTLLESMVVTALTAPKRAPGPRTNKKPPD